MLTELRKVRYPVETALLLALCFVLPLVEAPKSLLWIAYGVTWLVNRIRARDFGGRWDSWDTLIAVWIASGFVVAAFAGLHGSEWRGAGDLLRYGSLLWFVKRAGYRVRELKWMLGWLVASTVVGLAVGYFRMWSGIGKSGTLQLHSVGHVNHTAIYLAIMLGVCASWVFIGRQRIVAGAVTLLLLVSLFVAASRSGVAAGLLTLAVLALVWWPRSRVPAALAAAVLVASGLLGLLRGAEVFEKHTESVQAGHALNYREQAWSLALSTWQR